MDGSAVFTAVRNNWALYPAYTLVTIDISAWGDGAYHTISFDSSTNGTTGVTNFFVDDIAVSACPEMRCSELAFVHRARTWFRPCCNAPFLLSLLPIFGYGHSSHSMRRSSFFRFPQSSNERKRK